MRVAFLPAALADIREITHYLEMENPAAADRFLDRMDGLVAKLEQFPKLGKPFGLQSLSLRQFFIDGHVVIYRVASQVDIIRVIHASRDIAAIFGRDERDV